MSKFPNTGSSSNGNRVIEKTKIDNELYFDNLDALGPNWGEAFAEPMSCAFADGTERYKLAIKYATPGTLFNYKAGVASIGTDLFICGSSSVRPSKYTLSTDSWSEGSMAYNDYGSLDVSTGGFGYQGKAYFYTNNPNFGTSVNSLELKRYDPVANTWTTLTSLSSGNLGTVLYGFMGIANGYAYFMQMVKSSTAGYVPSGFPTVYKYEFSSGSWSSAAVTPPLIMAGGLASGTSGADFFIRGNNGIACNMSDTEFLIHVRGPYAAGALYSPILNTEEIYKFDANANTFTFVCRFKPGSSEVSSIGLWDSTETNTTPYKKLRTDSKIFYEDGIIYLWNPLWFGLKAYSIAEQKQYFVPIKSSAIAHPMSCFDGGKVYMFSGYANADFAGGTSANPNNNGIIIDLTAISAFLNKEKTLAVNVRSFD